MIFLPYKMDTRKAGLPLFTVLICIVCCWVYYEQYSADNKYFKAVHSFCETYIDRHTDSFLKNVHGYQSGYMCFQLFDEIRDSDDSELMISKLASGSKPSGLFAIREEDIKHVRTLLDNTYKSYEVNVPKALTSELAYDPKEMNVAKMVTSTFSHADIFHLLGNLLFFYIFAASVELVIGNIIFALFITGSTFGTSLAYSYTMANVENALPTVGLSGVVMATVAALAIMLPHARIRCFFWFVVFVRVFRVPALLLAVWYLGWDIYDMKTSGKNSYVNYVAHLSGGAIGALFGLYYVMFKREVIKKAAEHY